MRVSKYDSRDKSAPSLCFVGDCYLSSKYNREPFHPGIIRQISESDLSLVNLEGPVDAGNAAPKWGSTHTQRNGTISSLRETGFDVAALANNHIMDRGKEGLSETIDRCTNVGLETIGAGENFDKAISPLRKEISGVDIAIINLCQKEFGVAEKDKAGVAWISQPGIERAIRKTATEADITVIVAHGGVEYVPIPPQQWQQKLQSFIDLGADIVISHHPHVAQAWEHYAGGEIFHSLGNFAFTIESRPATRWSYTVDIEINTSAKSVANSLVRLIETADGQVQPMSKRNPSVYWDFLQQQSATIEKSTSEPGYWQEVSLRKFEESYDHRFADYGTGHFVSLFHHPIRELDRLTRGVFSKEEMRQEDYLKLLDYIQNEGHQDVMQTALKLKTNVTPDYRTPEIQAEIDELETMVDQRPDRTRYEQLMYYTKKALRRLS